MAEVETVMTGFKGYSPAQKTQPIKKREPLKNTLKGRPAEEQKAPVLPPTSADMVVVHIPDE